MSMLADRLSGAEVYYPEGPHVPEDDLQMRRRIELAVALRDHEDEAARADGAEAELAARL